MWNRLWAGRTRWKDRHRLGRRGREKNEREEENEIKKLENFDGRQEEGEKE
jgi:hypothetical protein